MSENVYVKGQFDMACWEKGPDGEPVQRWTARAYNGVVQEGLGLLGNVLHGGQRVTTNGPFLFLHSASYAAGNSAYNWASISGSQVSGYSASLLPITFASTNATAGSYTATTAITFTIAGTQTVSGGGLLYHTSASCPTNVASQSVKLYNVGTFTAAQNVQSNNILSVTVTLSVGTA